MAEEKNDLMEKIVSLCKRRGFVFPGSEIYGGMANTWDYGPYGVELKNNIKRRWWKKFIEDREDMVGLDAALIMNPKVWEASGHLANFTDPLVECEKCHNRFREDALEEKKCPNCGGKLTAPKQFNMMFKTFFGSAEESANIAYFRPETAQGIFVNFKNIIDTTRKKLPFGIGQIGKAFRNEITPGNFIFRTREFEQMEIEYFIPVPKKDKDWENIFQDWRKEMIGWIKDLGIDVKKEIHELNVPKDELAHYSKKTIDFLYNFPFGQKELYGLAYRTDFDLKSHGLDYVDENNNKFIPHVIEPSLGVDRSFLAALCSAYTEENLTPSPSPSQERGAKEEKRVVLKLPNWLAPVKVAVFPLLKNKPELVKKAKEIFDSLKTDYRCEFDDNGNVGKRYRRQDEIGTPYCLTVDFDSLETDDVTVRDRDSMKQVRVKIKELGEYFKEKLEK
ncbi:MAG: glycine--tRNA ligase [Patescibacteria group bacterium]|nr:glycine--tRNA ligase [Patescibacteria group bacterium]